MKIVSSVSTGVVLAAPSIDWTPLVSTVRSILKKRKWAVEFRVFNAPNTKFKVNGLQAQLSKGDTFAFIEDDDEDTFIVLVGQKKLGDLTQKAYDKVDDNSTVKKVKLSDFPITPSNTSAKPGIQVKPVAQPKLTVDSPFNISEKILRGQVPSKDEYYSVAFIGTQAETKRVKNGREGIIMGPARFDNKQAMSIWTTDGHVLISKALEAYLLPVSYDNSEKISYQKYTSLFIEWQTAMTRIAKSKEDTRQQSYDKAVELRMSDDWVGRTVYYKFSNGTFAQAIQAIDYRNNKIGISGSGSKLRWLPVSGIIKFKEDNSV